ncbi:FG-GAP repeat domain-containing protein [Streptomyces griseoruber]|uniref:FG-GAP repeat domain-containing protein n=1 Tax=Streptomyces griseoruber TaxID=1943 RepID=UPI00379D4ED8
MRRTTPAALTAALLAAGLSPLVLSAPASAALAKHYDDFNGDGYRDLAYSNMISGSRGEGEDFWGGAVRVVYGTAQGLDTSRTRLVHQDSAGVPGTGEDDDQFGSSLASGDLNKDGYADLVVGNNSEKVGSSAYRGTVTVVWGSRTGLSGGTDLAPKSGARMYFGSDLAVGDFTGDGSPDLAVIGGSEAWLYRGPFTKTGRTGTVSKIDKPAWNSAALAAGKVDGDGRTDLVVLGVQFYGSRIKERAWFLKGTASGLAPGPAKTLGDANKGLDPEAVIGDFDKNGYGDIALGLPGLNGDKGAVTVWRGTSAGPSGSTTYTQNTSGVPGTAAAGDLFGRSLSAADANGDGYADLAVGVPGEDGGGGRNSQGGVTVFRGGSGGLSGARSSWIPQTVQGPAAAEAYFGYAVRLRDLNQDGRADLTIGSNEGGVLLPGTSTVPTATGATVLPEFGSNLID